MFTCSRCLLPLFQLLEAVQKVVGWHRARRVLVQGLWNWDGFKDDASTAATSSDPKTDPPPKTEAHTAPFYPAVSRRATVPV